MFTRFALVFALVLPGLFLGGAVAQELPDFPSEIQTTPDRGEGAAADGTIQIDGCRIEPMAEPTIFATETGRLIMVPEVGQEVSEDEVIAKVDDVVAQLQLRVKYWEYQAEKIKLESDIELRYSEKNSQVKEASYLDARDANAKVKGAVSPNMLRFRQFEWETAKLSIEKTINDHKISTAAAEVKLAEFDLAKRMVDRHEIHSVVNGIVEERYRHEGEWVKPGDPIVKLTRKDRLRVTGKLKFFRGTPAQLKGQKVTIEIPTRLGPNRTILASSTVESVITHVGSKVDDNGSYKIVAEFDNTPDEDYWSGVEGVTMRIQLPLKN